MERALVFCTAWIAGDPGRYADWVNYYADFFRGEPVDLLVVNDGPVPSGIDLRPADVIAFPDRLGRWSLMCMPGFKRSFYTAVRAAVWRGYHRVGHIESDCWLLPTGREEFLYALFSHGHRVPWLPNSGHCESALQVINNPVSLQYFLHRYEDGLFEETWHFEQSIDGQLQPAYFLKGERWNGRPDGLAQHRPDDQFIANMPYRVFRWLRAQHEARCGQVVNSPTTNERDPCPTPASTGTP